MIMKKFIITIILALATSLSFTANAQITITKSESQLKEVKTISPYWEWLYTDKTEDGETQYLWALKSTNQFDKNWFWLSLGTNKEECIASINSLIEIFDTAGKEDVYYIKDKYGETIAVSVIKAMGKQLIFRDTNHRYAGHAQTEKIFLNKLLKYFEEL